MKSKISILLLAVSLWSANTSQAAFLVKKSATTTVAAQTAPAEVLAATPATAEQKEMAAAMETKVNSEKKSALYRFFHRQGKPSAQMSKLVYVILAIIGFGWLAMGINDNFADYEWLLSLLLYILGWLPGLIYTLIRMKKYYK